MSDRDIPSKQKLIDMLAERSRKHDAFRLAETAFSDGRADGYADEMNAFDIAHGEVLDWLNDTDHLDELLGFLRAAETPGRKFTGVGELERTGYIPAGSAAERELAPSEAASFEKAFAASPRRIETRERHTDHSIPCPTCGSYDLPEGRAEKAAEPRELAPSEAASFEKAFAASPRRIETSAGMGPPTPDNRMVICPACTCQFVAISVNDQTERRALQEHIAWAWSIIASAGGGDWSKESADWREAAGKWERARNHYDGLAVKTGPAPTCKTHGVELAFDGDECWECKKERQL